MYNNNCNRCFGKDVRLQLYDGSEKCAGEISLGDRLSGVDNQVLTVEDVYTGHETFLYQISMQNGRSIHVTGQHPMKSGNQSVFACNLKVGDELSLADGSSDVVIAVEYIPYDDIVYNFTFLDSDEGVYLIANDFYAGDLRMQNQSPPLPERVLTTEEQQRLEELNRRRHV